MIYDRQITLSSAGSRKATHWPAQTLYWSELVERLRVAVRGPETLMEYLALPKPKQDELKDVGGFVGGTFSNNRRNVHTRATVDLITLDLDSIPAGGTANVLRRLDGLGCSYAVYSTRKHHEAAPRLRVLAPVDRTATGEEQEPLSRKLGQIIGLELCDPTTFDNNRLMYWPSCSADSVYVYQSADKPFLSVDGLLAMYADWRNIQEWPQVPGAGPAHVRMAAKQGDPTAKQGVVGAFCRQYDIYQAMETFLPSVYIPADDGSGRYTYVGGSTVGGAIVYDNGQFLYSHHATDPTSGRLVNAFDLVRFHKFGEQDDEAKPDTPVNKLPSYTAMCAFALNDAGVAALINQERYERAVTEFEGTRPAEEETANWIRKLIVSPTTGMPAKTIQNAQIAMEHDPKLKGKIRMDTFADALMGVGPFPWAPREEQGGMFRWTDSDDAGLRSYLERILGFRVRDLINDALVLAAAKNAFNPVTDYLGALQWDGIRRLDTLFIDYFGAADTEYTRAVTRKSFVGAVARAMQPGVKYDTMPVLTGAQGLGKTTLIQKMGKSWFSNSIESFDGKEAAELLQGVWIVEIGEMSAYSRSDVKTIKGFLSRCDDQYRAAYARNAEKHLRRCVFFGTSNESDYLKDPTGGRRFWPVDVGVITPKKSVFVDLDAEVDQLWAEAVMRWRLGEILFLTGTANDEAKRQQESHAEVDPREGAIRDFVERRVPAGWEKRTLAERRLYWSGEFGRVEGESVERDRICAAEIWCECFGSELRYMKRADAIAINSVLDRMPEWQKCKDAYRFGPHGRVKGGYVRRA